MICLVIVLRGKGSERQRSETRHREEWREQSEKCGWTVISSKYDVSQHKERLRKGRVYRKFCGNGREKREEGIKDQEGGGQNVRSL